MPEISRSFCLSQGLGGDRKLFEAMGRNFKSSQICARQFNRPLSLFSSSSVVLVVAIVCCAPLLYHYCGALSTLLLLLALFLCRYLQLLSRFGPSDRQRRMLFLLDTVNALTRTDGGRLLLWLFAQLGCEGAYSVDYDVLRTS